MTTPSKVLIPRFDTFGDIVLLQGFLAELSKEWPEAELHLLVRQRYTALKPLYSPRLRWHGTNMEPRCVLPRALRADDDVMALLAEPWDICLSTTFSRSWLDDEVALHLNKAGTRTIRVAQAAGPRPPGSEIENVFVAEKLHEISKYEILFEHLTGRRTELPKPRLCVPLEADAQALQLLADLELEPRRFVVCVPGGGLNNPIKLWRPRGFAECIRQVESKHALQTLLMGHESEKAVVEETRRLAQDLGATPLLWIGRDDQVDLMAALLQHARLYLGNDTGPMHIAQAVGTPAVAVFGGGQWPRFAPAGSAIVCLSPWECYGCDWHCMFGHAMCIESVKEADVLAAAERVLRAPPSRYEVVESKPEATPARSLLKPASRQFTVVSRHATDLPLTQNHVLALEQLETYRQTQLAAELARSNSLATLLEEREAEAADLRNLCEHLDAQVSLLRSQKKSAEEDLNQIEVHRQTQLAADLATSNALERLVAERNAEVADLRNRCEHLEAQLSLLRSQKESVEEALASSSRYGSAADSEMASVRAELSSSIAARDRLEEEIKRSRQDPFEWLASSSTHPAGIQFVHQNADAALVSVVIPVYNGASFIDRCIRSVWEQDSAGYRIEILVCDDGSTDDSRELAQTLAKESPFPLQVLSHAMNANRGVGPTRNLGLQHSRGEFVALLDVDDIWLPSKTKTQTSYFAGHSEVQCVCSFGYNRDLNRKPVTGWSGSEIAGDYVDAPPPEDYRPPYTFHQLLKGDPIVNSTVMFRRGAVAKTGGYTEVMAHQAEDWLLFLKLALDVPIHVIPTPLIEYTIHPNSYTTQYFNEGLAYGAQIECALYLVHWMLQHPEYRELAKWVYRRHYPRLLAARGNGYRLIESYYREHHGDTDDLKSFEAHLSHLYARLDNLQRYHGLIEAQINILRRVPGMVWAYHLALTVWRRLRK